MCQFTFNSLVASPDTANVLSGLSVYWVLIVLHFSLASNNQGCDEGNLAPPLPPSPSPSSHVSADAATSTPRQLCNDPRGCVKALSRVVSLPGMGVLIERLRTARANTVSPLHLSMELAARVVLSKASLSMADIHYMAAAAKFMSSKMPELLCVVDADGSTAFSVAASLPHFASIDRSKLPSLRTLSLLLVQSMAVATPAASKILRIADNNGELAVHLAASFGASESLIYLLETFPELSRCPSASGLLPLDLCLASDFVHCQDALQRISKLTRI